VLLTICWSLFEFARFREPVALGRVAELLVIAVMFFQLPPLLAFALYFSVLHSLRHMLAVADRKPVGTLIVYLFDAYRAAFPITMVTIIMGAVAYMLLGGLSFDMTQLMRVVFIGIAAMTYPHVLLIEIAKRLEVIPSRARREESDLAMRFANAQRSLQE
jgi:Brp/Blh family beta-carotene 15,15'-monooxygenase